MRSVALIMTLLLVGCRSGAPGETSGAAIYARRCAACHQSSGKGMGGSFPPLVGSRWLLEDPGTPVRIVLAGVQGKIDVNGTSFDNAMPGLGVVLGDAEVAAVLTYARSAWGNQAAAVTAEAVARERKASAARAQPWSAASLEEARRTP